MWQVVAGESFRCTECGHEINAGTDCLSQMPEIMPEHFRRGKYENFCIDCAQCAACGPPCYIRWLAHGVTPTEVKEVTSCAYCGECIPKGTRTTIQEFYAWPAPLTGSEDERVTADRGGFLAELGRPDSGYQGLTLSSGCRLAHGTLLAMKHSDVFNVPV